MPLEIKGGQSFMASHFLIYLEDLLLLNHTILVLVHLTYEVSEFCVANCMIGAFQHVIQKVSSFLGIKTAIVILVELLESFLQVTSHFIVSLRSGLCLSLLITAAAHKIIFK